MSDYKVKAKAFKRMTGLDVPCNSGFDIGTAEFNKRSKVYQDWLIHHKTYINELI